MTDEQRGLVETHYRLIWLLVRRAQALGPALERMETEELVQRACLWACRHALTFDALKGAFGTRVGWAVRGAMTEATDRKGQPALTNHDFGWTPQSARPVGARLDDADEAARVNAAVEGLPARHAQALYLLFWQGLSMSEAARELGVTKERVRQIRAHALRELRGRLAGGRGDVSSPINEERP
jgi:RNA polymerase sigma-70 factor (ECF subfamily)